ncbi:MAG TPA: hypothetical protein DIW23_12080 [Anaerolineae bacterium]|nr:hypothetical protein [Anaerolineae bacterium]
MDEDKTKMLKVALWISDPWKVTGDFDFTCWHCGSKYNGDFPDKTHRQDCIWLTNYQEVESWLTKRTNDLLSEPVCCASFVSFGVHHRDCRTVQGAS